MIPQLSFSLDVERRELILGAPIVKTYLKEIRGQHFRIEVVGDRFHGHEYIYIIQFERKIAHVQYYCGSTSNPAQRFKQHNRTWPLYRLTQQDISTLLTDWEYCWAGLETMQDRTFRRRHTFLRACCQALDVDGMDKQGEFRLLSAAKKHTSNGIIMAANQRGIGWRVARLFQADRSLEFALKRRKQSLAHFLPAVDVPF